MIEETLEATLREACLHFDPDLASYSRPPRPAAARCRAVGLTLARPRLHAPGAGAVRSASGR